MTGQKTLVELIKIRKWASDQMDEFFRENRPLDMAISSTSNWPGVI